MRSNLPKDERPDHFALAYDTWAPVSFKDGKVPDDKRSEWISELEKIAISEDYEHAFRRWKESFTAPGDRVFELTLITRLLVGHGNSSATDVGITVHHTWGVPVIPGSAVKGLLAHFVSTVYGPTDPSLPPWEQDEKEQARVKYQGPSWEGGRIVRGPGEFYRVMFGAPEADQDARMREKGYEAGAYAGRVIFHDALYVPKSAPENCPFVGDVLTVHQKQYYDTAGERWPNDYDSPNPVSFVTVRPGVKFLFALSGRSDWTELAEKLLRQALQAWGVGGKTSLGYGRLVDVSSQSSSSPQGRTAHQPPPAPKSKVEVVLLETRSKSGKWRAQHEPSGLEGVIINSDEVPPSSKPGDRIHVEVQSVSAKKGQDSNFRYLPPSQATGPTPPASQKKK